MDNLPPSLNKTYDQILRRLQREPHRTLVENALRWLVAAYHLLTVEELIEACAVRLHDDGPRLGRRLKPAQLAALLRYFVVFRKHGTSKQLAPHEVSMNDHIVFAHFSVKEYLLHPAEMAADLQPSFSLELKLSHLHVASSCVGYLLQTNTMQQRQEVFTLRPYAWDLWALHAMASTADFVQNIEPRAKDLFEQVAFGDGSKVPVDLQRVVWWSQSENILLECLRRPYFFAEYAIRSEDGHSSSPQLIEPLHPSAEEIRLLVIHPSEYQFTGIRCSTKVVSLRTSVSYDAIFYKRGDTTMEKQIWLNGHPFRLTENAEENLRRRRVLDSVERPIWIDVACINRHDKKERSSQFSLMAKIYSAAASVWISFGQISDEETWALEIIKSVKRLSEYDKTSDRESLAHLLQSRARTNPFLAIKSFLELFFGKKLWGVQEALLARKVVLVHGTHVLPIGSLQNFVVQTLYDLPLVIDDATEFAHDSAVLENSPMWMRLESIFRP